MFRSRKEAVDAYQLLYEERMVLEGEIKLIKVREDLVKEWIVNTLEVHNVHGASGSNWEVELSKGINGKIEDFDPFSQFVAEHRLSGTFGLLYRRLNQEQVRAWWNKGLTLPGIGQEPYVKLHHRVRA